MVLVHVGLDPVCSWGTAIPDRGKCFLLAVFGNVLTSPGTYLANGIAVFGVLLRNALQLLMLPFSKK